MNSADIKFDTGAMRADAGEKPRPDLISPFFKDRVGQHLRKGAARYGEYNWTRGIPISRCVASLERHLMQYEMGAKDEDHMAAIACNAMFILHYEEGIRHGFLPEALDDMPKYLQGQTKDQVKG
jgi:hypothetical protein